MSPIRGIRSETNQSLLGQMYSVIRTGRQPRRSLLQSLLRLFDEHKVTILVCLFVCLFVCCPLSLPVCAQVGGAYLCMRACVRASERACVCVCVYVCVCASTSIDIVHN